MPANESHDPLWAVLSSAPHVAMATLDREAVPSAPGVFVLFRDRPSVQIGKAANLRATVSQLLARQGPASVSPVRRSVAEFLGIANARDIAGLRYRPTTEDHERISQWLRECSIVWRACASESDAVRLEARLRTEREAAGQLGVGPQP